MPAGLTKEYFDQALGKLATKQELKQLATKDDLSRIEASIVTQTDLSNLRNKLKTSFFNLQSSVDRYLKRTEDWHDELNVLQARFKQVVHLLDQKGLVKEEETHLA